MGRAVAAVVAAVTIVLCAAPPALAAPREDPRIATAAVACLKALGGRVGVPGYLVDALRGDNEAGMRSAIVAVEGAPVRRAWNTFVAIPTCVLLAADLGIHPVQAGEGDLGAVSSDFWGAWTGGITQHNPPIPPFTLDVTIRRGAVGTTVGTGHYTGTSPCDVHWTLSRASTHQLVVNEVVDSGTCFSNVAVTLDLVNGTIVYDFEQGNGHGVLRRR